jgi:hypothetical protein
MYQFTGLQPVIGEDRTLQLMEEIAALESRLEDMGMDGDCAYERAISRVYTGMVEERKRQLARLTNLRHC